MKKLGVLAAIALCSCAPLDAYKPFVDDVANPAVLAADEAHCLPLAKSYSAPLSANSIAAAAVQGGAKEASGAALNPLVPLLGAAGGATSELLSEVGLLNDSQQKIFLRCLDRRGQRSGAYSVIDPNE